MLGTERRGGELGLLNFIVKTLTGPCGYSRGLRCRIRGLARSTIIPCGPPGAACSMFQSRPVPSSCGSIATCPGVGREWTYGSRDWKLILFRLSLPSVRPAFGGVGAGSELGFGPFETCSRDVRDLGRRRPETERGEGIPRFYNWSIAYVFVPSTSPLPTTRPRAVTRPHPYFFFPSFLSQLCCLYYRSSEALWALRRVS